MAVSFEDAHRHNDLSLLERFNQTCVILGVIAVAKSKVESVGQIRDRLMSALEHIDADRLLAAPDCGLGLLSRELARSKLSNMCEAVRAIG
jgi:5-methyltetrahydropteroyltriglutamate--homocysteine methyltransferase